MTAFDNALRKAVVAVARALGTAVIVTVITAGAYNTTTGQGTDTTASVTVKGFALEERDLDAMGLAKVGERAVLVPAASLTTEPVATSDRFTIGSSGYSIAKVDKIRAQDANACYVLHGNGPA